MQDKQEIRNNRIDHIYRLVDSTAKSLEKIKSMLKNLEKDDQRKSYQEVEGIMGIYDGVSMVAADGTKYEVAANYAAKSRLVEGDSLKRIEEGTNIVFKQIDKVDRKKVEGIMTKKEGKWYIISDSGTFKVSDTAAEFQHAELHDEASAFIPAKGNTLYAALDSIKKKVKPVETVPQAPTRSTPSPKPVNSQSRPVVTKPASTPAPAHAPAKPAPRPAQRPAVNKSKPASPKPAPRPTSRPAPKPFVKKEFVEEIISPKAAQPTITTQANLDDDDLR